MLPHKYNGNKVHLSKDMKEVNFEHLNLEKRSDNPYFIYEKGSKETVYIKTIKLSMQSETFELEAYNKMYAKVKDAHNQAYIAFSNDVEVI